MAGSRAVRTRPVRRAEPAIRRRTGHRAGRPRRRAPGAADRREPGAPPGRVAVFAPAPEGYAAHGAVIPQLGGVPGPAELMRRHHVRRLPVVERGGCPVGVVGLGDLAAEEDPHSAPADIDRSATSR
ncbi:CBS domain-containing protein [Streptomyces lasalocidi]|uniref:CBS domain-containing protein n=1 Tax=Streptomyces lasalocidi TaxID=324833 RepID=UPI001F4F7DC3|nr:CBS domain-containing protein [Streptomyces lasalocidi]